RSGDRATTGDRLLLFPAPRRGLTMSRSGERGTRPLMLLRTAPVRGLTPRGADMADKGFTPEKPTDGAGPAAAPPPGILMQAAPGARQALTLLLLINLFNYIDRQVLAAVEPDIRKHFLAEDSPGAAFWLGLNDNPKFWTGCLSMAFLVCYMLLSP